MTLKEMRKLAGLTQEELAEKVGVSRVELSYWENGRRTPTLSNLRSLINTLGMEHSLIWSETWK